MTPQDITGWLAIGISILSLYLVWKKAPHENRGYDASAAESFEKAATSAAERVVKLEIRITQLECKVEELVDENTSLRQDNDDLRDWAERLVHQVQSIGGIEPVKMRRREDHGSQR